MSLISAGSISLDSTFKSPLIGLGEDIDGYLCILIIKYLPPVSDIGKLGT